MSKPNANQFEQYRENALHFTMGMAIVYAIYWAILSVTNTQQTGGIHILGDVLLVILSVSGIIMGILYAIHLSKKK